MKIVIIGYSGSGKSTLAENLSRHYSIPKLHMDTLQFQPGWIDSDRDWMEKEMKQFLSEHRDWVIDGNYSWCCYQERMEQATRSSFSTSLVGTVSIEGGNDTAVIKAASVRVWQQDALNALTGNSSVGSFGMDEQKVPEKGIKASTPPTLRNFSLSRIKKS